MKRPSNPLIVLIIVAIFLGGFLAWQNGFFDKLFKKSEPNNNISEEKGKSSLKEYIPQIVEKQINEETEAYSVEIKYPSVIGLADTMASEEISRYFKEKAEKDANDFKKDAAENAIKEAGVQSQLISGYQAFWYDASFLSFKTETMSYVEGMTHPSNYDSVFNYDIKGRKQLFLNDFFNTGSAYLEMLSIKSKEEVKRQLGEDYDEFMASEGTAPKKENYENFLFDKDGLTFIFGQYQVGSSAAGIIYAKILYSDMAEFNSQSEIIKKITGK